MPVKDQSSLVLLPLITDETRDVQVRDLNKLTRLEVIFSISCVSVHRPATHAVMGQRVLPEFTLGVHDETGHPQQTRQTQRKHSNTRLL